MEDLILDAQNIDAVVQALDNIHHTIKFVSSLIVVLVMANLLATVHNR